MVQIRSTQKLAISPEDGLCDVTRKIVKYEDYYKHGEKIIRIDVIDEFIQEKVVDSITERKIILTKPVEHFYYTGADIDAIFTSIGTDIVTSASYTEQVKSNREIVLITKTVAASDTGYHGMDTWVADTGSYKIVTDFSE
jgi:hypothetical protein